MRLECIHDLFQDSVQDKNSNLALGGNSGGHLRMKKRQQFGPLLQWDLMGSNCSNYSSGGVSRELAIVSISPGSTSSLGFEARTFVPERPNLGDGS